ncbi:MAG TPA: GNAT family N-acetyltransferase [Flavobacteriaceae bacterium]|nr:GNAT family N-acetyltransferase [Flavobacteriaceae bacterium]
MKIIIANAMHLHYAASICATIAESAKVRGTGIATRTPEHIQEKIKQGNAVIALDNQTFVGFCYIDTWEDEKYVANSALIVHPDYRGRGVARAIKKKIFQLAKVKYPNAKAFSITTGLAVMKMNSELGCKPVTFSELTTDPAFWKGCETCQNFDVLKRTNREMCLCTGMLYDPTQKKSKSRKMKTFERLKRIKEATFLKPKLK